MITDLQLIMRLKTSVNLWFIYSIRTNLKFSSDRSFTYTFISVLFERKREKPDRDEIKMHLCKRVCNRQNGKRIRQVTNASLRLTWGPIRTKNKRKYFMWFVRNSLFVFVFCERRLHRISIRCFHLVFAILVLIWFYERLDYGYYCQLLFIIHAIRATFFFSYSYERHLKCAESALAWWLFLVLIFIFFFFIYENRLSDCVFTCSTRFQFNWSSIEAIIFGCSFRFFFMRFSSFPFLHFILQTEIDYTISGISDSLDKKCTIFIVTTLHC